MFADQFVPTTPAEHDARTVSLELGIEPLSAGALSTLTFLATLIEAKAVVEVGTGTGVSGLALFAGMSKQGILTSVDSEAERQAEARKAFITSGIPTQRFRLIAGTPLDVLPKLRDGAYDLVFVDGDMLEFVEYVAQALRLLRHGGILVVNHALWQNRVADPGNEDDETVIMRETLQSISETEEFTAVLLPVGDGLLAAVKA